MSFSQLAQLFDLPKTTIQRMVQRGEQQDAKDMNLILSQAITVQIQI